MRSEMDPVTQTEETVDRVLVMRRQEAFYVTMNWLDLQPSKYEVMSSCGRYSVSTPVDIECRDKMAGWCAEIIQSCKLRSETGEIALSMLDRFLSTPPGTKARLDRSTYQLASMVALYTAIKIHEPLAMDPNLISFLSQGAFSCRHIEAMEMEILQALQWRVNPPTSLAFIRELLDLIPEQVLDDDMRRTAFDLSQVQSALATVSHEFITVPASTIAYAALMNSLESINLDGEVLEHISYILSQVLQLDCYSKEVMEARCGLYQSILGIRPVASSFVRSRKVGPAYSTTMSVEVSPCSILVANDAIEMLWSKH